jgi:hypothetical protein
MVERGNPLSALVAAYIPERVKIILSGAGWVKLVENGGNAFSIPPTEPTCGALLPWKLIKNTDGSCSWHKRAAVILQDSL